MIWLLACIKNSPVDSAALGDSGCVFGSMPGACIEDFELEDPDGTTWTLSEHDPVLVAVTLMWVPAHQDVIRALDEVQEDLGITTFDVLVQNTLGEEPTSDDAALWVSSLDLSLTVLLADADFNASWDDPVDSGGYAVFIESGVITWRGRTQADVALLRERL
ncbi:MAG: hypothetical protein GY913_35145 [Proteobacteria bacterium]|nr:hypothetical protein [Pseudomonadota bacterium]